MNEVMGILLFIVFGMLLSNIARSIGAKIGFSEFLLCKLKEMKRHF